MLKEQWEYKITFIDVSHTNKGDVDKMESYLTKVLGVEGWEVVGVSPSRQADTHLVILKRPVQAS